MTTFPDDQRREPRVTCGVSLWVQPLSLDLGSPGWHLLCEDLSIGGARISTPLTLPLAAPLLVHLDLEDGTAPMRLSARVVWTAWEPALERWASGLRFDPLGRPERRRLQQLVTQALPAG